MSASMPAAGTPPQPRRVRGLRWLAGVLLALVLGSAALLAARLEQVKLGAQAYLYGYPLVITELTRRHAALTLGPENQLRRVRQFPDASFKGVVRPNVDTLYTTAFIDMALGPWVFEMAANDQRYELMPFMDAWTNVFAAPGTRLNGTAGGRFLLVGPGWQGEVPAGLALLRSPTRLVWLIGRTQTNGAADYPLVHQLQDGVQLQRLQTPASGFNSGPPLSTAGTEERTWQASSPPPAPPLQQMQALGTEAFFVQLAALMVDNPPATADAPMLASLRQLGITPGQVPRFSLLDRWSLGLGRWAADVKVARELKTPRGLVRGWATPPAQLGQYGTDYTTRAVVAMIGLGANLPADAMYPNTRVDGQGQALNGRHRYRLHFNAGDMPPVRAFWSITAYGADDYLIHTPLQRHALGDRDGLVLNSDGSLDILVQATAPAAPMQANWLPVRADEPFLLNARLYWPLPAALDGRWGMPAVERLD